MEIDKRVEKKLEVGDSFGELALINGSPRNETAIACGLVELW
jgi:CRP-like cAMP-binding protein